MKIDRQMNLVSTVDTEQYGELAVHSTPIASEVFEKYFLVMSKTFAAIFQEGLNTVAGPSVAALMLQKQAEQMGIWDGPDGVKAGLIAEIRRLTNVFVLGDSGWTMMPLETVVTRGMIDSRDLREVEGGIVFFTLVWLIQPRRMAPMTITAMCGLWGQQITSLNATAFQASLKMPTAPEKSGENVTFGETPPLEQLQVPS